MLVVMGGPSRDGSPFFRSVLGGVFEGEGLLLAVWRWWRLQQFRCFDAQSLGQAIDDLDARGILPALDGTDVGAVNVSAVRKLFLRQASGMPKPA